MKQFKHLKNNKRRFGFSTEALFTMKRKGEFMQFRYSAQIACADCDYAYVGESRNFKRRLRQHQNDVKKKRITSNALAEHVDATGHNIDWEAKSVIGQDKNLRSRLYLESLEIQRTRHTLNRN